MIMMMMMEKLFIVGCLCLLSVSANPTLPTSCYPGYERTTNGCIPCKAGTYNKDGEECLKCRVCHRGQTEYKKCSSTQNTYCACPDGKHEVHGICVPCSTCQIGTVIERVCSNNLDTKCTDCPKGMTTNHTNSKKCFPTPPNSNKPTVHNHNYIYKNENDVKTGLTYAGITVSVILVVLFAIYCIRRNWKTSRALCVTRRSDSNPLNEEDEVDVDMEEENVHLQVLDQNQMLLPELNLSRPPDGNHKEVVALTADIYEDLGAKLNPDNTNKNWKRLAGILGFHQEDVARWQLNVHNATQDMLYEFSTKQDSTVYKLHSALMAIGREDAARIVEPHVFK